MYKIKYLIVLMIILLAIGCDTKKTEDNTAADNDDMVADTAHNNTGMINNSDNDFVLETASAGMMEVELGKMALKRGKSTQVKNFGQMMVTDHTKANNELKALATKLNINLPDSMMDKHKEMYSDLAETKSEDFDKEYISMMVDDHEKDISEFEEASKDDERADVKAWASKTLPVLKKHHERAKQIHDSFK